MLGLSFGARVGLGLNIGQGLRTKAKVGLGLRIGARAEH